MVDRITPNMQDRFPETPNVPSRSYGASSTWTGWIGFAAVIMIMLGTFHVIQGLVALLKDDYFVVTSSRLVVSANYTAWGWVHLIFGVIVLLAGVCLFAGQWWARAVGTVIAFSSAVVNLSFLAAYPIWSLMMIALDITVILALTVHGSEMKSD